MGFGINLCLCVASIVLMCSTVTSQNTTPDSQLTTTIEDVTATLTNAIISTLDTNNTTDNTTDIPINGTAAPLCHILNEWGTPQFFIKYSMDLIWDVTCKCENICRHHFTRASDEEIERNRIERNYLLSSTNRVKFITVTTVLSVVFVSGFIGNTLTIACLTCWLKKKSSTFLFIQSLAFSDMLLLLVALPLKEMEIFSLTDKYLGGNWCFLSYFVRDFCLAISVLTLTVISFERFYAICYPFKAQYRCSTNRARLLIVVTWIASGILSLPTVFVAIWMHNLIPHRIPDTVGDYSTAAECKAEKTISSKRGKCTNLRPKSMETSALDHNICLAYHEDQTWIHIFYLYRLTLLYFFPMTVMCYTYTYSCVSLYKSARSAKSMQGDGDKKTSSSNGKEVTSTGSSAPSSGQEKGDKPGDDKGEGSIRARIKVMQMLIAMFFVFMVCWGPTLFYAVLKSFFIQPRVHEAYIRFALQTLAYANSSINPYFYMAMSSQFRREFRKKFGWMVGLSPTLPGDTVVSTSATRSTRYQSGVYSTPSSGRT